MTNPHKQAPQDKNTKIKSAKYDIQVSEGLLDKARDRYLILTGWSNFGSSPEGIWVNHNIPDLPETGVTVEEAVDIQWELDSQ